MFFFTYLRRELRRRMRQAIFIALGLAIGIGLVITVMGASSGVKAAQAKVLRALYGIGTDVTVTTKPKRPSGPRGSPQGGTGIRIGPRGGQICTNGTCKPTRGGTTIDNLASADYGKVLPSATVTSSSDLASEVTGSAASAARLAGDLGKWLAVLVLIAAFAVASLLTMAAVARRVPEFGTLKALGWRSSRVVGQVLGESVSTGIGGGLAGVGLGFAGVAIIDKIAPKLSATVPSASGGGGSLQTAGGTGPVTVSPAASHATVAVPMSASVTIGAIVLAVVLAIAGGLIAGSFGGWRAARLRPAAALARVA